MAGILSSGSLTLGRHTREFEEAFATAHGAPHAVAVSSGTAALEIILRSLDVAGRDVVVPSNTFYATAAAVTHAGGRVVLADVNPATLALSAATVEAALTANTTAVVLVHIGGLIPADVEELRRLCDRRGVRLVEDAAHAHGSTFDGRHAGSFGVAAAFSFYPTKVITSGEGGMIVASDERIRDDAVVYRDQGKAGFLGNVHIKPGYAWRMSEIHALVGKVHLRHLDEFLARRAHIARRYDAGLAGIPDVEPVPVPAVCRSNYYKYVALLSPAVDRSMLKKELKEHHGVSLSGEVYEMPLHQQPVLAKEAAQLCLPVAEDVCARQICLPLHSDMTDAEAGHVLQSLAATTAELADRAADR
jgi:dTDP-4-amino-4,6-dideoxygalactose transaminase